MKWRETGFVLVPVVWWIVLSTQLCTTLCLELKSIDSSVLANYCPGKNVARRGYQAMKTVLLSLVVLTIAFPNQNAPNFVKDSAVVVVSARWSKTRLTTDQAQSNTTEAAPAAAVTPAGKLYEKRRVNAPTGDRGPDADTTDGRAAQLESIVQESRRPKPKAVDGYAYRVKLKNAGPKVIEILFWEYQFSEPSNSSTMVRRQFLCGVNIKPDKEKEVLSFSLSGPSDVITVGALADKSPTSMQENVVINRVEYADGSIWQRKDWSFAEVKLSYARAIGTPWGAEMCRAL
jgi:hypothetical protein